MPFSVILVNRHGRQDLWKIRIALFVVSERVRHSCGHSGLVTGNKGHFSVEEKGRQKDAGNRQTVKETTRVHL